MELVSKIWRASFGGKIPEISDVLFIHVVEGRGPFFLLIFCGVFFFFFFVSPCLLTGYLDTSIQQRCVRHTFLLLCTQVLRIVRKNN